MSSGVAMPSCATHQDLLKNGESRRVTTKPAQSFTRKGYLSIFQTMSVILWSFSSEVSSHGITPTNFMIEAELKKRMPKNRSGGAMLATNSLMEIDEVTLVQKRFLEKSIENVLLMGDRIFNQTKRHPKKRRTGLWYDMQACLVNSSLFSIETSSTT